MNLAAQNSKEENMESDVLKNDDGLISGKECIQPLADGLEPMRRYEQEHAKHLLLLADFANYRRRKEREIDCAEDNGRREVFLSFLQILDNFELAISHVTPTPDPVADGVKTIYRQIILMLESYDVRPIESVGKRFDPEYHDALLMMESNEWQKGIVLKELRRGYFYRRKLLRPAQVAVASGESTLVSDPASKDSYKHPR
jgi:molecular chaperone GrpE